MFAASLEVNFDVYMISLAGGGKGELWKRKKTLTYLGKIFLCCGKVLLAHVLKQYFLYTASLNGSTVQFSPLYFIEPFACLK
jgi:hypothetical protein